MSSDKSNSDKKNKSGKSNFKNSVYQWLGIGLVIAILYFTGLHTHVIAGMQRAILYTGLMNAKTTDIEKADGPYLNDTDYSFTMQTADGEMMELRDSKGQVTFLNVWASWCPPCIAEMPTIQNLYSEVSDHDNIRFIMLSVDQNLNDAINFMEDNEYGMPFQFPASNIPQIIQNPALPTTYVISKEGQIVYEKEGFADYSRSGFSDWLIGLSK